MGVKWKAAYSAFTGGAVGFFSRRIAMRRDQQLLRSAIDGKFLLHPFKSLRDVENARC